MAKVRGSAKTRERYPNAYRSWTSDDDERLKRRHRDGAPVQDLVEEFGRTRGGIWARLERLGLVIQPGAPARATPPGDGPKATEHREAGR